jgi:hypothetical protein
MNLTLGRVQNHPLNFAWHLPPSEPVVTSTSESPAALFWNMTPKSKLFINYNEDAIPEQTSVAPLSSLPRTNSSLSVVADQPSLPKSSMACLLFVSEPILDFYWNITPKYSFVTERLDIGATTDIFNETLTVIQLGTSSFDNGNQSQLLLPVFNPSLGWSQDNAWTSTWHLHTPEPMIRASITAFFRNVIPEKKLFIRNKHVIPTETGDASLPSIPLQNLTSFVSVELPWLPTTSRFIDVYMSKPLADFFWNATPTDKICTQHTDYYITGAHDVALVSVSSGISSLHATNHRFSVKWLMHLLLVVLSIFFNLKAKDMASIPSVASTDCAIDFGSIASCEVNNGKSADMFNNLSSYSFLFGIDDDDGGGGGGSGGDDGGCSLCYSLDSDGIDNDVDSLCYSMDDDGENGDSFSIFSCASSAAFVLPVAECSVPMKRHSARIAAMQHVCYKKFF